MARLRYLHYCNLTRLMPARQIRVLPLFAVAWAFFATLARGIARPNDWAEAHWLISYDVGFIKRGLPGTLIASFIEGAGSNVELVVLVASFVALMGLLAALGYVFYRVARLNPSAASDGVLIAVATSPFVVMMGHLNGYYDHLVIVLTALALYLALRDRHLAAASVLGVGMLIHETLLAIGLPLITLVLVGRFIRDERGSGTLVRNAAPYVLPLLVFAGIALHQSLVVDGGALHDELVALLSRYEFIRDGKHLSIPAAFTTSFYSYLSAESDRFWERVFDYAYVVKIAPVVALGLVVARYQVKGRPFARALTVLTAAVVLAPLALHVIAWDTSRIWTYPIVMTLLAVWVLAELGYRFRASPATTRLLYDAGMVTVVVSVFINTTLMDEQVERYSDATRIILYLPLFALMLWRSQRLARPVPEEVEALVAERAS